MEPSPNGYNNTTLTPKSQAPLGRGSRKVVGPKEQDIYHEIVSPRNVRRCIHATCNIGSKLYGKFASHGRQGMGVLGRATSQRLLYPTPIITNALDR